MVTIGESLSHYRILEEIGHGGMGVVYRARDEHLPRDVALKVLPAGLFADETARSRFRREAQTLSQLNHPNIATVYDFDRENGVDFLAMEFVEGETLAAKVAEGPLPEKEILALGTQIAEALEDAHEHEIIHRDLKPGNVMVTSKGRAKVLDFGLAKLLKPVELDHATASLAETQSGAVIGTMPYMSPEQLQGKPADARTDVYALGTVLYEMATGRRPFPQEQTSPLIAAILTETPQPPRQLNAQVSRGLEGIIQKALERNPEQRYQSAMELREDLGLVLAQKPMVGARRFRAVMFWFGLALTVVAVALSFTWLFTRFTPHPAPQLTERRLTANSSENLVTGGAISPDGKYLAYGDQGGLHLKLIKTGETLNIPQPEGTSVPSANAWWPNGWFPDGTKFIVAGVVPGQLPSAWIVSVLGGPPRKLRDDADPWAVSPDGRLIVFGVAPGFMRSREIWLTGAQGEAPRRFAGGSEKDAFFGGTWSPDGQKLAYARFHLTPDGLVCSIESQALVAGQETVILSDQGLCDTGVRLLWRPDGRLIYTKLESETSGGERNLWEIRVNSHTGSSAGKPRRITNWTGVGVGMSNGTPDGKQLILRKGKNKPDVFVGELEGGGHRLISPRRLTLNENDDYVGDWTADSKSVLFWSNRNGTWDIFKQGLDQPDAQPLVTGPDYKQQPVSSPDGSWILYLSSAGSDIGATTPVRIMRVASSGGAPEQVLDGRGINTLACARTPSSLCLFGQENLDRTQLIFSRFDPIHGTTQEFNRIDFRKPNSPYSWQLSRDGSNVAFSQFDDQEARIRIIPLDGGEAREVRVEGHNRVLGLWWTTDGKGFFVGGGEFSHQLLYYVDLRGHAKTLWQQHVSGSWPTWGIPSPDGRHLAFVGYSVEGNLWMIENP